MIINIIHSVGNIIDYQVMLLKYKQSLEVIIFLHYQLKDMEDNSLVLFRVIKLH